MHHVTYRVSSSSLEPLNITYVDENGNSQTVSGINLTSTDWTYSFNAPDGKLLSLSAIIEEQYIPSDQDTSNIFNILIEVDYVEVKRANLAAKGVPLSIEYTIPTS